MAGAPDELSKKLPPIPAPRDFVERAHYLVEYYPQCFWFGHVKMQIESLQHIRLVIERLRGYGDLSAWYCAQELYIRLLKYCRENELVLF